MGSFSLVRCLLVTASLFWNFSVIGSVDAVSLSSSGSSVVLNDIPYFIPPYASGKVPLDIDSLKECVSVGGLYPVTLITTSETNGNFSTLVESFAAKDDVFQSGFLQSTLSA
jgi:hypothetical protein